MSLKFLAYYFLYWTGQPSNLFLQPNSALKYLLGNGVLRAAESEVGPRGNY